MKEKLEEAKSKTNGDNSKTRKEVNEKNKEIKSLNQKLEDTLKRLRDETNLRAKAEAELKVKDSTIEALREVVNLQKSASQQAGGVRPSSPQGSSGRGMERRTELCKDFQRQGHCFRGTSCRYFHPPGRTQANTQSHINMKPDCKYWLEGYCRKEESLCWGKHNPSLCGTQHKQNHSAGPNLNVNSPNFVQTLAKAVSQSLAGVHQQAATDPSRGQQQLGLQPAQSQQLSMSNQQSQNMMTSQQQPTMMPMMYLPNGQNMYFPALQGRQGHGQ